MLKKTLLNSASPIAIMCVIGLHFGSWPSSVADDKEHHNSPTAGVLLPAGKTPMDHAKDNTPHPVYGGQLGSLIASGEGGYGSYNHGDAGDAHGKTIDFSEMPISEVMRRQRLNLGDPDRFFAVGKYQEIPTTLSAAVQQLGLSPDTKFGPDVQEAIFREYLIAVKQPAVKAYVTGQSDNRVRAERALAAEFASVADPRTGRSMYGHIGGNRASISTTETGAALDKEQDSYRVAIASGKSPDEAWKSLSSYKR